MLFLLRCKVKLCYNTIFFELSSTERNLFKLKLFIECVEVVCEILFQKLNLKMFFIHSMHIFRLTVATSGECQFIDCYNCTTFDMVWVDYLLQSNHRACIVVTDRLSIHSDQPLFNISLYIKNRSLIWQSEVTEWIVHNCRE